MSGSTVHSEGGGSFHPPALQPLLLVLTHVALVALATLCVVGAFLGAERAAAMFRSAPMASFWTALMLLLLGSLAFRAVRRSTMLLSAHLGCALILVGSMLNSPPMHDLLARAGVSNRLCEGMMILSPGQVESRVGVRQGSDRLALGELPFALRLADLWVEHYGRAALAYRPGPDESAVRLNAKEGRAIALLNEVGEPSRIAVRLLQRIEHARAVFGADPGRIVLVDAAGMRHSMPAQVGESVELEAPALTVRVVDAAGNAQPVGVEEGPAFVDVPGDPLNPLVVVAFDYADKGAAARQDNPTAGVLFSRTPMPGRWPEGLHLRYEHPGPVAAVEDSRSHHPAMEVEILRDGVTRTAWLIGDPRWPIRRISLGGRGGEEEPAKKPAGAELLLAPPAGPVRDKKADLRVLEDGREVRRKVVEVNHPLRYGGYQFTLQDLDAEEGWMLLAVRSGRGVSLVYVGMALLLIGVFGGLWVGPMVRSLRARIPGR